MVGVLLVSVMLLTASVSYLVWSNPDEIAIVSHSFIKDAAFIIENDDGTYKAFDGQTGELKSSASDVTTVWNWTRDNGLTSGRTWKEKVQFKGIISVDYNAPERQIFISNYTILDFTGSVLRVKDDTEYDDDYGIFRNKDAHATDIEIIGLNFDENAVGAFYGWAYIMWFQNVTNLVVRSCHLESPLVEYMLYFDEVINFTFRDNTINYVEFEDIYHNNMFFINNFLKNSVGHSIYFYGDSILFADNILSGAGAYIFGDSTNAIVSRNTIHSGKIYIKATCKGSVVSDNVVNVVIRQHCDGFIIDGANSTVTGNLLFSVPDVTNTGIRLSAEFSSVSDNMIVGFDTDGINLGGDCSHTILSSNVISGGGGSVLRGIYLQSGVDNCIVTNNIFNITGTGVVNNGAGNIVKHNLGFVTENSGTTTDKANGGTIAHGLVGTPTTVTLTSLNATYDSVGVIVAWDKPNSSSTNISLDIYWTNGTAIADSVIDVSWYAEYVP